MSTRARTLLATLLGLCLAVAGCATELDQAGTEPDADGAEGAEDTEGTVEGDPDRHTLRLTTWAGDDESQELQELVLDEINASQDVYEIIHEPVPADYYTRVETSLAGGVGADLMWLSQEYIANYADRGALLDITDQVAASDAPAAQLDNYNPDILQTAGHADGLYGLPWISQPVVLFYNPELFEEAGIDPPDDSWDWNAFHDTARELTDALGEGRYGFTLNGWPPLPMFIWQAGGEVISEDFASSPIDSPEAVEGASFYQEMVFNEDCCPSEETIAEQGFSEMFAAGNVAMFMGGAADTFDGLDEVGATVVPEGPAGRTTFAWTASTAVNAATEDPELAVEALIELTEGIHRWKLLPPREDLIERDTLLEMIPERWRAQKEGQIDTFMAAAPAARAYRIIPRHQEWDEIFWNEFAHPLFQGAGDPADVAAEARPALESVLP